MLHDNGSEDRKTQMLECMTRLKRELQVLDDLECHLAAVHVATACDYISLDINK